MKRTRLSEANFAAKIINDPKMTKMLALAVKHDHTIPANAIAAAGPKASDQDLVKLWSDLIDRSLSNTDYGDMSRDGKFDAWLAKLYTNHVADLEDITGEGAPALGAWKALSVRGLLDPKDQDFNRFTSIEQLQKVLRKPAYREALDKIKDQARVEKAKRDAKQVVLLNTPKYWAAIPLNYGSCYVFNNADGINANFCTGSSSGESWFQRYSGDGPIVDVLDKENLDSPDGKWQFHSATDQIVNAHQDDRHHMARNDAKFAKLFPGVMKKIIEALQAHSEELKQDSIKMGISRFGWNIAEEIERIKKKFPESVESGDPESNVASEEDLDHLFGRDRNQDEEPEQNYYQVRDGQGLYSHEYVRANDALEALHTVRANYPDGLGSLPRERLWFMQVVPNPNGGWLNAGAANGGRPQPPARV